MDADRIRVRIDLAYDGRPFHGFARQVDQPTVQGTLEAALTKVARDTPVTTVGAGRTDAGVHAEHQVVHADLPADLPLLSDLDRLRRALDVTCGPAITVWRVRRVPATFDARFSATLRRYRYLLCDAPGVSPLRRHEVWHVGPPSLDTDAMELGGSHLVGEHDFSSFCRRHGDQHLVRRVSRLVVRRRPRGIVEVAVEGPAFCHQMVRSIVGCLLTVGRGRRPPDWVAEARDARDRQAVGGVAPPHGLVLRAVRYR